MDAGEQGSRNLVVTWIEVPPGAEQRRHSQSECEQVYVVVRGSGRMWVAGDEEAVSQGDLVFIPPGSEHGITNDGDEPLAYVTVMSPQVSIEELFEGEIADEVPAYLDDDE